MKRRVADALIAHNPKLEVFQFGYEEIAEFEKITVKQARRKYRHLELNGPEEGTNGIQITLFDDEASRALELPGDYQPRGGLLNLRSSA